ncbi:hypothetical protein BJ741DRAFT_606226 [Chytriomyces cf. hyalinus JEL632]|nr:hypothetical protein BJ741DRAFT_606226 [Chytriomyces cf. hyalinus JEL632]
MSRMSPSPTGIFAGATVETSARENAQSLKTQEASLRETLATLEREEINLREQLKQIDPAHWERTGRIEWQDMQLRFVENTLRLQLRNRHLKKANKDGEFDEENGRGDGRGGGLETLSNTYGRNPLGMPKSLMEAAGTNRGIVEGAIGRNKRRRKDGNEKSEEGGGGDEEDCGGEGEGIDFVQAANAADGEIPDPDPQFFDFLAWVDAHTTGEEYGYVADFAVEGETQHDTQNSDSDEADSLDEEEECMDELEQSLVRELQQLERMRFGLGQEVDFVDSEASPSEF